MDSPKLFINCCILLFLLTFSAYPARAQDAPDPDSRLYNGHEYIRNGINAKGFPFFLDDRLQPGTLVYDGIFYKDIPLQYDLVLDELIIQDYTGKTLISLIPEKVNSFHIGTHIFRYLPGTPSVKTGFYEELCSGRDSINLFARREKRLVYPSNTEESARYVLHNTYFLRIGNTYSQVDYESSLLAAMRDKKAVVKKYIHDNNIRFNKDFENALIQTTLYYCKLTN